MSKETTPQIFSTKPPNTLHRIVSGTSSATNSVIGSLGSIGSSVGPNDGVAGLGWSMWFAIFLILAILGVNIFVYLAQGTQLLANITQYFTSIFAHLFGNVSKQVIGTSAQGVSGVAQGVNAVAEQTIQATQVSSSVNPSAIVGGGGGAISANNANVQNALNAALQTQGQKLDGVSADDATSAIQMNKSAGKSGYCYIGEERGFRSCVKVGENDACMSGDIFPSLDICVNPTLRQ
jgi:hypothetical protein